MDTFDKKPEESTTVGANISTEGGEIKPEGDLETDLSSDDQKPPKEGPAEDKERTKERLTSIREQLGLATEGEIGEETEGSLGEEIEGEIADGYTEEKESPKEPLDYFNVNVQGSLVDQEIKTGSDNKGEVVSENPYGTVERPERNGQEEDGQEEVFEKIQPETEAPEEVAEVTETTEKTEANEEDPFKLKELEASEGTYGPGFEDNETPPPVSSENATENSSPKQEPPPLPKQEKETPPPVSNENTTENSSPKQEPPPLPNQPPPLPGQRKEDFEREMAEMKKEMEEAKKILEESGANEKYNSNEQTENSKESENESEGEREASDENQVEEQTEEQFNRQLEIEVKLTTLRELRDEALADVTKLKIDRFVERSKMGPLGRSLATLRDLLNPKKDKETLKKEIMLRLRQKRLAEVELESIIEEMREKGRNPKEAQLKRVAQRIFLDTKYAENLGVYGAIPEKDKVGIYMFTRKVMETPRGKKVGFMRGLLSGITRRGEQSILKSI